MGRTDGDHRHRRQLLRRDTAHRHHRPARPLVRKPPRGTHGRGDGQAAPQPETHAHGRNDRTGNRHTQFSGRYRHVYLGRGQHGSGVAIAAAIAIHNIPEGIAVSVPIYYATGSRRKAFLLSLSSGLAEPVGALLAYAVLLPFLSPTLLGCLFGFVAGIMVFISLDELLPAAEEYGEHHISIYGVVTGMALMAVSLIVFS